MKPYCLAIESSCDETALALLDEDGRVLAEALSSQIEIHNFFGGVVPEVASRSHFDALSVLFSSIEKQVEKFRPQFVAVTKGPGLIGPLLVGTSFAEGLARGWNVPLRGIHHLRGHIASALLAPDVMQDENHSLTLLEKSSKIFPSLVLLVSGGHTEILKVSKNLNAIRLLETVDDAAGECFDKVAKLMGLPFPGGPQIEKIAEEIGQNPALLSTALEVSKLLPRPRDKDGNFSFSGLKTAARLMLEAKPELKAKPVFCYALQVAMAEILVRGLERSFSGLDASEKNLKNLIFCGGVSANKYIRSEMKKWALEKNISLWVPPLKYCTDNAVMIGAAAWVTGQEQDLTQVVSRVDL